MTGRSHRARSAAVSTAIVATAVAAWGVGVRVFHVPAYILPGPWSVLTRLVTDWDLLARNAGVTLTELIAGFALGIAMGVVTAVLIASSPTIERVLYPLLIAQQTIPMIVLAPLFIIWFGVGILPQILIVALICFFPVAISTSRGLLGADPTLVNLMKSFGSSRLQVFMKVRVPSSLPDFFTGLRLAATLSVVGTVVGEWTGAQAGLGRLIMLATNQLKTDLVFAAILLLVTAGVCLFLLTSLVERLLVPWSSAYVKDRGGQG